MFAIRFGEHAVAEIARLRAVERRGILNAVEQYLAHKPTEATGRKKMLRDEVSPWHKLRQDWQNRVGDFRVYYDVNEAEKTAIVRSVCRKDSSRTEELLL